MGELADGRRVGVRCVACLRRRRAARRGDAAGARSLSYRRSNRHASRSNHERPRGFVQPARVLMSPTRIRRFEGVDRSRSGKAFQLMIAATDERKP